MADPFLGQVQSFGFNFAPRGWAFCNGQILSIAQNSALFALLGTTYGGNGQTTFGLPDLRGRVSMHWGQGPGLSNYDIGEVAGVENVTMSQSQMPAHVHAEVFKVSSGGKLNTSPNGSNIGAAQIFTTAPLDSTLAPVGTTAPTGNSLPLNIQQPYLCLTWCICLSGIFPSRN
jgi:microcystin-dependent protein